MPMSPEEGKAAVALARGTLDAYVSGKEEGPTPPTAPVFSELRGVFVTLNRSGPGEERLRGCIGFPYPVRELGEAIRAATIAAASEDPRFPPVDKSELGSLVVEVSVLTRPTPLEAKRRQDLPSKVRIGEDGLIISSQGQSGLLLPQVATEFGMDQVEFLSQACLKAGLPPDFWLEPGTEVQVFQAEVFAEKTPRGDGVPVPPSGG